MGKAAGLAHDVGRSYGGIPDSAKWLFEDAHMENKPGKVPMDLRAKLVEESLASREVLVYCIAGHHAGIPDWS